MTISHTKTRGQSYNYDHIVAFCFNLGVSPRIMTISHTILD